MSETQSLVDPQKRFLGLDLLRAVAVSSVVLYHGKDLVLDAPNWLLRTFSRGWMGVDLFFVLSGYLIGLQAFNMNARRSPAGHVRHFWIKRWTRTVPMYALALLLYAGVKPLLFHAPFAGGLDWKWFFFLQNFGDIKDFGQSWSLCIEEQFYLVFPLLVLALHPRMPKILWVSPLILSAILRWTASIDLAPAGQILQIHPEQYTQTFRFRTLLMLDAISMGVLLAATRNVWSNWSVKARSFCGLGGVLLLAVIVPWKEFPDSPEKITLLYTLLACAFGGLLIAFEGVSDATARGLGYRFARPLALWSYSAYLLHPLVVRVFDRYVAADLSWWMKLSLYFAVVFAISRFTYVWVEEWGLSLRKRLLR